MAEGTVVRETESVRKRSNAEDTVACETESGRQRINPEIFWLLLIFMLALVLRSLAAMSRQMVLFDEASYARMAQNLLAGSQPWDITGAFDTHLSILYPVVTASFAVMVRNVVTAGYMVSVLFSSMMVLPVYLFGKIMWNNRTGMAAAALVAVLPLLIGSAATLDGQNLFAFWVLCAMFFGYRMQFTKRCMCAMIAGTSLGIAYVDDPTALYYLVTLLVLLLIIGFRQELSNYANKAAAQFLVMFLVFAIPSVAFMTWQNHSLTLNDRPMDELYAAVNDLKPGSLEREQQIMGLDASGEIKQTALVQGEGLSTTLLRKPLQVMGASLQRDYHYYVAGIGALLPIWLIPLLGLGLNKTVWSRREALKYAYFALLMVPLLTLPLKWPDVRFMLPYMAIVMLWAGRGWLNLESWAVGTAAELRGWKGPRVKRAIQVAVACLVLAPVAGLALWNVANTDYPMQYRNAGEWLKGHGGDGSVLMSREASTAFYAGADQMEMPYASQQEVVDYCLSHNADYLLISRSIVDTLRPQLAGLMEPAAAQSESGGHIQEVYRSGEGGPQDTIIYRVT